MLHADKTGTPPYAASSPLPPPGEDVPLENSAPVTAAAMSVSPLLKLLPGCWSWCWPEESPKDACPTRAWNVSKSGMHLSMENNMRERKAEHQVKDLGLGKGRARFSAYLYESTSGTTDSGDCQLDCTSKQLHQHRLSVTQPRPAPLKRLIRGLDVKR